MDEYIERKAALDALRKIRNPNYSSAQMRMMSMAKSEIIRLRAADVEPVRHGRWYNKTENLPDPAGFGLIPVRNVWRCSQCGLPIVNETEDQDRLFKYCPSCGAKMDQETEE